MYNLPEHLQARAMCALTADTDRHRFAIGSSSVAVRGAPNEVHLVSYSEDANRIDTDLAFPLDGADSEGATLLGTEVTQISSSPYDRGSLVVAVRGTQDATEKANRLLFY